MQSNASYCRYAMIDQVRFTTRCVIMWPSTSAQASMNMLRGVVLVFHDISMQVRTRCRIYYNFIALCKHSACLQSGAGQQASPVVVH